MQISLHIQYQAYWSASSIGGAHAIKLSNIGPNVKLFLNVIFVMATHFYKFKNKNVKKITIIFHLIFCQCHMEPLEMG